MGFDMTRCPQTEDEARDWFYAGIGQQLGAPATDWEAVMKPVASPRLWARRDSQCVDAVLCVHAAIQRAPRRAASSCRQRCPDENGYYTRCMQYLDDAAGTYSHADDPQAAQFSAKSSGLVWSWYWVAGHEYAPVQGANENGVAGGGLTEAQCAGDD